MAYNKKTWLARLGQGLNKFSIDGATPVPIINQPDSVTQQGDALSAGNLNDLEQRIADAFDDVEERKADKSTTDALQSQINQQDARLDQQESRLENLEQKAGDYSVVQYRGTNAVPTGKASYGLVKNIVGKTRAWNQLVKNGNFADTSNWALNGTGTFTVSDGVASVTCNEANRITQSLGSLVIGHKYLVSYKLKFSVADYSGFSVRLSDLNRDLYIDDWKETTSWQTVSQIVSNEYISANAVIMFRDARTTKSEFKLTDVLIRDLTPIFPNLPSTDLVTSNIPNLLKRCSDLLKYDTYDTSSLVDTVVSGAKSTSINIWDEQGRNGRYNNNTGIYFNDANSRWCSLNPIPVEPSTWYYRDTSLISNIYFYDINMNYLGYVGVEANPFQTPNNCFYINFNTFASYGTTYQHNLQICLNSASEKTIYHPHILDTLSLSETVTLKSAGSVSEVLTLETGKKTRPIENEGLGSLNWTKVNAYNSFYALISDKKIGVANALCSHYPCLTSSVNASSIVSNPNAIGQNSTNNAIYFYSADTASMTEQEFATYMANVEMNYELATPLSDEQVCDPIIDNFIEVEGGGTVETIQAQTPVIDNCLDVGYLTL